MTPEVGKSYMTSVASGGGWTRVTVKEVWEQVGSTWVKVDGVFTSGPEYGVTLSADLLITPEEFRARMAPKPFTARFPGTCHLCKTGIRPGQEVRYFYPLDVRVKRNPVVHVSCPAKEVTV